MDKNLADLGSRGAKIHKMEREGWFTGPKWLLDEKQWPDQKDLKCTKDIKMNTNTSGKNISMPMSKSLMNGKHFLREASIGRPWE